MFYLLLPLLSFYLTESPGGKKDYNHNKGPSLKIEGRTFVI
jgi:hypothetical protein